MDLMNYYDLYTCNDIRQGFEPEEHNNPVHVCLMEHLPDRVYSGEKHVHDLQDSFSQELVALLKARDDLYRQLRPSTATWGLANYEREYGITPDRTKPIHERLARWRAKRRGQGTSTVAAMKELAESFMPSEVEVYEYPREYRFEIKLIDSSVIQFNVVDLFSAVEELKPAHLAVWIGYLLKANVKTYVAALAHTLTMIPAELEFDASLRVQVGVSACATGTFFNTIRAGGVENYG